MSAVIPAQRFYFRPKRVRVLLEFDIEELVASVEGVMSLRTIWGLQIIEAAGVLQMLKSGTYGRINHPAGFIELRRNPGSNYVIFEWDGGVYGDDIREAHCLDGGQMAQLIKDLENCLS